MPSSIRRSAIIAGNVAKLKAARAEAAAKGADLVLFPELFVCGYPPEDLVRKPAFAAACRAAVEALAPEITGAPAVLVGTVWPDEDKVYNAVALIEDGRITGVRFKVDLPNYGVFDEKRVFDAGPLPGPLNFKGVRIGVPICEDIWKEEVCECLAECGAEILLVPNGSPFEWNKDDVRLNVAVARVAETGLPLAYLNQIGGQDELVFDGASFVLNARPQLAVQMPAWEEAVVDHRVGEGRRRLELQARPKAVLEEGDAAGLPRLRARASRLRDQERLSGRRAGPFGRRRLGAGRSARRRCARPRARACGHAALPLHVGREPRATQPPAPRRSGIRYDTVPIAPAVEGLYGMLGPMFAGRPRDTAEENVQSRVRGTTLMAISNKFGSMLVTTGNKSEMSVGYATIYGDMNGGFNPIKDLYKMEVYRLCRWRNANVPKGAKGPGGVVIPENIITKAPTAELRENQKDQDSLPPYEQLDDILACLVENEMPLPDIVKRGHAAETRQEDRAAALSRRVQAAAGGARHQDFVAQLRSRPPLSRDQPLPRGPRGAAAAAPRAGAGHHQAPGRRRRRQLRLWSGRSPKKRQLRSWRERLGAPPLDPAKGLALWDPSDFKSGSRVAILVGVLEGEAPRIIRRVIRCWR